MYGLRVHDYEFQHTYGQVAEREAPNELGNACRGGQGDVIELATGLPS